MTHTIITQSSVLLLISLLMTNVERPLYPSSQYQTGFTTLKLLYTQPKLFPHQDIASIDNFFDCLQK